MRKQPFRLLNQQLGDELAARLIDGESADWAGFYGRPASSACVPEQVWPASFG